MQSPAQGPLRRHPPGAHLRARSESMTTQSACCQPATITPAAGVTHTAVAVEATPREASRTGVCCGSAADASTAGACCDPAAKREAVAGGTTCCS
jgi:hypothetical protein